MSQRTTITVFLSTIFALYLVGFSTGGCVGGSEGGEGEEETDELTSDDISAISAALTGAFGELSADGFSGALTLEASTTTVPLSGEYFCPVDGHITWSGNATVTVPDPPATGPSTASMMVSFYVSDPTNNLNDCEVSDDVILDGILTFTMTMEDSDYTATFTGTIGVNRRGPTGGLVPITSECFILLTYTNSGASGSICGWSVS